VCAFALFFTDGLTPPARPRVRTLPTLRACNKPRPLTRQRFGFRVYNNDAAGGRAKARERAMAWTPMRINQTPWAQGLDEARGLIHKQISHKPDNRPFASGPTWFADPVSNYPTPTAAYEMSSKGRKGIHRLPPPGPRPHLNKYTYNIKKYNQ